ncbi:hypothetical protein K1T71_002095 [Dendrolimus kikuchii]|uniref:Uncharacterized protein n=1 Tax=Dendrolimus kikuchii TaxID=765133 RepID=A0ACC1DFS1_9NEOP|nr:hypothetical protein K1T71_002095 [Dendrolimus kikuchii]
MPKAKNGSHQTSCELQVAIREAKSAAWVELLGTLDNDPWGRPYHLVLTGHGCFGRYLCRIGRESSSGCQHCSASVEDTALHTLQECPAWDGERRVLGANIGPDLSLPAVVQAMVGGQPEWDAVASFCEAVMSAKEAAERERERAAALLSRRNNRSRRRRNTDLRPP